MPQLLTPDICVIGAGPGGIAAAVKAAGHGVPVVLIERERMGGQSFQRRRRPLDGAARGGKARSRPQKRRAVRD